MKMSTVSNCAEAFTLYNVQKYTKVCNFQNTDWWALRAGLVARFARLVSRPSGLVSRASHLVSRLAPWLVALRAWLGGIIAKRTERAANQVRSHGSFI